MKAIITSMIALSWLLIPTVSSAAPSEAQERASEGATQIGRWCDTGIPSMPKFDTVIELWKLKDGTYQRRVLVKNVGKAKIGVVVHSANKVDGMYRIHDDFGEYVRVGNDGFLRMYDSQGFIRKAMPVGINAKPAQCRGGASR